MKKIIKGKMYDTDTAKRIGGFYNNQTSFAFLAEDLYRKKTGEFFLHGEGGANTRYAVRSENSDHWTGSEAIIPMTYDSAREWAEKHLTADEYESAFGAVSEDDSKTQMCISISTSAAEKLRRMASEQGITISALVEKFASNLF